MTYTKIPENLPDCEFLHVLNKKANNRHDINFNFLGKLEDFRQRVSSEACYINVLFPEYTPHDEQFHLKQLFHVADMILGRNQLEEMNSAELFILAIALYGHDWGMAVSEDEKHYIVTGELLEGKNVEDLWILPDEQDRFKEFALRQQLTTDAEGHLDEISTEIWREYIRETHASRSAERVRRFFDTIDGGVAEAAPRVCEGHWLTFEDLQDYKRYPSDFSVLREPVNLRAIAIYLRLIDLFDIGEDRTPYVIWKFVAPRDPRSKMEWKKHRALQPITTHEFLTGRIIKVDGSTDDHEVYAALEDLRIHCEAELRRCNELLALMNDPHHKLDIYHIDWRIMARRFKPVSIRFEFNRDRMFEILSEEIYQGDHYVFLRELLQNSIDAIRMRRAVLERNEVTPGTVGVIEVTVEHKNGGDAEITWRDDGIGMDEYIIQNYLAIAGRSYYRSADFERTGIQMDPISRFGIGILSCFMVAERVEIDTFKDPYIPPRSDALKIVIPAIRRQFRIETRSQLGARVGTEVRVFVEGKKITAEDENQPAKPLNVTEYLSTVAGFVEFPIVITEGDRKTIIIHPYHDAEDIRQRFSDDFEIHQLDLDYPWSEAIMPQDLPAAREVLRLVQLDVASDLKLKGYEGVLNYLVPIDDVDFEESEVMARRSESKYSGRRIRASDDWDHGARGKTVGLSSSSFRQEGFGVYRDGILLPHTYPTRWMSRRAYDLPGQKIIVNLPKSIFPLTDLARTQLRTRHENWDEPISEAYLQYLLDTSLDALLKLDPAERCYQLGRLIEFHNISADSLWQIFPQGRWPLVILESGGQLNALEWQQVAAEALYISPKILDFELGRLVSQELLYKKKYEGPLAHWAGERCIVNPSRAATTINDTIELAMNMWQTPAKQSHNFAAIRFLEPPQEDIPPILQEVWLPIVVPKEPPEVDAILEKAIDDPTGLNPVERILFNRVISGAASRYGTIGKSIGTLPETTEFPPPFQNSFGYGWRIVNLKHPIGQALIRLRSAFVLSIERKTLPAEKLGCLDDALHEISSYISYREGIIYNWKEFSKALYNIWSIASDLKLISISKIEELMPAMEDFVPRTVFKREIDSATWRYPRMYLEKIENIREFGKPLT